jgi:glutamate 5-kinase
MSRKLLAGVRRVVVKIGSRLIKEAPAERARELASAAGAARARGIEMVLVSSGAIALGMERLQLAERPKLMPELQACAAIGQSRLMQLYDQAFAAEQLICGQVLLTHEDVADRGRFLNARHALSAMLALGAVPVINENDTVAIEEITFGDNDRLAALVANLISADLLVVLTDVEGLYDGDPRQPGAKLLPLVTDIDREAAPVAGQSVSGVGRGGMASKVSAAKIAAKSGVPAVVCSGRRPGVIAAVLGGEEVGTLFVPGVDRLGSRKHWIAFTLRPSGTVVVDDGARKALIEGKKSLLPSGVREVRGDFAAGDAIAVTDLQAHEFARGLAAYSARELGQIRGKRSSEIEGILGYKRTDELIHRDDLVLL